MEVHLSGREQVVCIPSVIRGRSREVMERNVRDAEYEARKAFALAEEVKFEVKDTDSLFQYCRTGPFLSLNPSR